MLKEEINRLMKYAPISSVTHSRSVSNVSSINIEEDFGYSSAKNTLEIKKDALNFTTPLNDRSIDKDKFNVPSELNHTPELFADLRELSIKTMFFK